MFRPITIVLTLFSLISVSAQDNQVKEESQDRNATRVNEIKLNVFNLVTFKTLDASYEYIIDAESGFGASVLLNLRSNDSNEDIYYNEKFAFTPYYRRYFSSTKHAYGFFIEAFAMYNLQGDYNRFFEENGFSDETSSNGALGFAVGGKFLTRKGIIFDIYGGLGRNFIASNTDVSTDVVPRIGASFGYRF